MTDIHVINGRLFASTVPGLVLRKDELALADGLSITISGTDEGGDTRTLSFVGNELLTKASQNGEWKVQQDGEWAVSLTGPVSFDWSAPGYSNFVAPIFGQAGIDGGAGDTTDKTVRVVLADDSPALSVTGGLTDAELRASAVPVSVASLPLPSLAATAANQTTEIAGLAAILATIDDGVAVTGTFWQATQPVSGTFWQATQPVSIGAVVHVDDNASTLSIDDGGGSITVDGTVAVSGTVTVTGGLTDTQLRASAVPVSLATLPNSSNFDVALSTRLKPADTLTGVTTVGTITNVVHVDDNSATLSIDDGAGSITVDNGGTFAVQASQAGTWTVQPGNTANTTAWKVDASSVAVPITDNSGSLTVDQPTGTNLHMVVDSGTVTTVGTVTTITNVVHVDDNTGSLTVDNNGTFAVQASIAAAQTLANVTTLGTITNVVHIDDNAGLISIDDGGGSITVDGTVAITAAALPLPSNAAQETGGNLATIKTDLDTLVTAGGGGYVRQDSTATIAKESGGNLATLAAVNFATAALQSTGNTSLASILTALTGLLIAQNATSASQVGPLVQAQVSDSPASFSPDTVAPLQVTSEGRLRVSAVHADIESAWAGLDINPFHSANPFAMENLYV